MGEDIMIGIDLGDRESEVGVLGPGGGWSGACGWRRRRRHWRRRWAFGCRAARRRALPGACEKPVCRGSTPGWTCWWSRSDD